MGALLATATAAAAYRSRTCRRSVSLSSSAMSVVASYFDDRQDRRMLKQAAVLDAVAGCCSPMVDEALAEHTTATLARRFNPIGDRARLRLPSLIAAADDEIRVCDLTPPFRPGRPTISHHLKVLREAGLIEGERRGTSGLLPRRPPATCSNCPR
jgi:ArsR family transcriptional regulator